ncbi:Spermidine hydroxycinnamoyl transferase [Morella rubra]|uniref:Spermidine hydroxycinnamoyl transferase n=1 Tax=Morella rubra TaxID=262757 RepID=A0A6A1WJ09_9ROSI|nr:Spermidine hydroxycinnamoyl transferase [Morella rubra]
MLTIKSAIANSMIKKKKSANSMVFPSEPTPSTILWLSEGGGSSSSVKTSARGSPNQRRSRGCSFACSLAEEMGLRHTIVEGDAQVLITQVLNSDVLADWIIEAEVLTMRATLRSHEHWIFRWIPREGNGLAHALARWRLQVDVPDTVVVEDIPRSILHCDAFGSMPFSMDTMKTSLSRALVHYYPLAGRLRWIKGGRLELVCDAKGAQLLEAYSEVKLEELGDFAPTEAVQDLVPKIDDTTPVENWPLVLVQLTRFRCGGVCVGTAISHTVADGRGNASFINLWAKLARGDGLRDDEIPFHDRTVLRSHEPLRPPHTTKKNDL